MVRDQDEFSFEEANQTWHECSTEKMLEFSCGEHLIVSLEDECKEMLSIWFS